MLMVVDSERMFPLQNMRYLNMEVTDLFHNMIEMKRANCPNWTDESASDLGVQILWMYSVLSRWLVDHMEVAKDNSFLITSRDRESVRRHCQNIGYTLTESGAASVDVTFTLEGGHPEFTIPEGTQVSTQDIEGLSAIIFETGADQLVGVGVDTISISCTQGETISEEVLGSSDGTTGQLHSLSQKPVIWQSETVEIYVDGAWEAWTRVDSFVDSNGTSKHYRIEVDEEEAYSIHFGDSVNGKIPNRGTNNIRATYRKGGGSSGNVAADTIIELISNVLYIDSLTNSKASTGGSDRESLDHAKLFGPASIKTLDRIVSVEDIEKLAETFVSTKFGGIAKAKAFKVGGLSLSVMIVPQAGGEPSTELKSELQTYLDDRKIIGTSVQVTDPIYVALNVAVSLHIMDSYAPAQVTAEVKKRIIAYLSPTYQDPDTNLYPYGFGRDIYLSDLYALIDGTPGVDHCELTSPTSNTLVDDYKIVVPGVIGVTTTGARGEVAHYSSINMLAKSTWTPS
jgi:uncharacterized phage protein gp47/JayE